MRVGLICPYSLTTPGGVQGQVLGLARSLRTLGHDARVLGPCDGPPPDGGVTPLGRSVPTAANGSPAFAQYRPTGPDGSHEGFALVVLDVADGLITDITSYLDAQRLFPLFDLPYQLER